eukprot:4692750-Karenia_brevis.AAC.1
MTQFSLPRANTCESRTVWVMVMSKSNVGAHACRNAGQPGQGKIAMKTQLMDMGGLWCTSNVPCNTRS